MLRGMQLRHAASFCYAAPVVPCAAILADIVAVAYVRQRDIRDLVI